MDVNVTPDKRKIFMQEEKMLLATIKTSLKSMFDPGTSSYEVNQKPLNQLSFNMKTNNDEDKEITSKELNKKVEEFPRKGFPSLSSFKRGFSEMSGKSKCKKEPKAKQAKLSMFCDNVREFGNKIFKINKSLSVESFANNDGGNQEMIGKRNAEIVRSGNDGVTPVDSSSACTTTSSNNFNVSFTDSDISPELVYIEKEHKGDEKDDREEEEERVKLKVVEHRSNEIQLITDDNSNDEEERKHIDEHEKAEKINCYSEEIIIIEQRSTDKPSTGKDQDNVLKKKKNDFRDCLEQRKVATVDFKMKQLQEAVKIDENSDRQESISRSFRAKIAPENNTAAEEELTKNINKDSFKNMEIVGQFNLGFILAKLQDDIFIIDQHASDEKYNFENQQKHSTLQTQRLIIPKQLELTAVNESILMDNIEIFRKNGFDFEINEDAQTMCKVKLVSVPVSKNWTYGVEDVEELIFMLSDSPGVMCRPSRVRKMFASRACRMSTMIGTALSREEMRKIVNHMGEMDHPWNCPHGRPTMRHVINLNMIASSEQ